MHPRLVALDGPLKGQVFVLSADEASIGREAGNSICPADPSVSRRHCLINRPAPGCFRLADLDSRNGTLVNGLPVRERLLAHGDQVQVGSSLFLFLVSEAEQEATPSSIRWEPGRIETGTVLRLQREQSVYLRPEEVLASPAAVSRAARGLNTLLKVCTAVHTTNGLEVLAQRLLALMLEALPAERGAIVLLEPGREEPVAAFGRDRAAGPAEAVPLSSALVERAVREAVAVLSNDAVVDGQIRSVLAAPLFGSQGPIGVIYLDSADRRAGFDEDDLQVVTAVGVAAGAAIGNARQLERLEADNQRLQEEINVQHDMVGDSPPMREVYRFIAKVAPLDSTVLISGESGTGKELVARAIHRNSPRAPRPFVAVNCAALTETLVESELFGYEKGAFTGALAQKKGKLEVADGGTVFLDEIGELPLVLQPKLLRVLQEREFERVGGTRPIRVDIRLIVATNRDLQAAAASGGFRQDLYYRLNVISLTMPPLRERREDIALLATYFTSKHARLSKRRLEGISKETRACLLEYDWPGNVRELENAIERAVVLGSGNVILPEDLPEVVLEAAPSASGADESYHAAVKEEKKQLVLRAIEQTRGNFTEAAKLLGLHPNYLHRLIRNLGLRSAIQKAVGR